MTLDANKTSRMTVPVLGGLLLAAALLLIPACSGDREGPVDPPGPTGPGISVGDGTVAEGNVARLTITMDSTLTDPVTLRYYTTNGTALAPGDFQAVDVQDTLPAGTTELQVIVLTEDDFVVEGSENFLITVTGVSAGHLVDSVGVATITDNETVSYALKVRPLLQQSCVSATFCHRGVTPSSGLGMGTDAPYETIMAAVGPITGGPVVIPGDSTSGLYRITTNSYAPYPRRMPSGLAPLPDSLKQRIRDWILEGAHNN